jgi:hypothetical protein
MNRLHTLVLASVGSGLHERGQFCANAAAPAVQSPPSPSHGAAPPPAGEQTKADKRQQSKAEKKAQRMAARGDCRAQGKQQSLSGQELRSFVKNCMAAPQ